MKNQLIEKVLRDIDLSPTHEKNAREKYKGISNYLQENGLECSFHPQGSFLLGTVTRPYRDGTDKAYDLDILNVLNGYEYSTIPGNIKNGIGSLLKKHKKYQQLLKEEDKHCWTLEYAQLNNIQFNLDLVPCIFKEQYYDTDVSNLDINQVKVLITEKNSIGDYDWKESNPLGYAKWFKSISDKHLTEQNILEQRNFIFEELKNYYLSIEEVPEHYFRSSLQRAVQYLKRSRDIFYYRSKSLAFKPSSFVITSLVSSSVEDKDGLNIYEILTEFILKYRDGTIPIIQNNKLLNPIDSSEDLASNWSQKKKVIMDGWIEDIERQMVNEANEERFKQNLFNDIAPNSISLSLNAREVDEVKPWGDYH